MNSHNAFNKIFQKREEKKLLDNCVRCVKLNIHFLRSIRQGMLKIISGVQNNMGGLFTI